MTDKTELDELFDQELEEHAELFAEIVNDENEELLSDEELDKLVYEDGASTEGIVLFIQGLKDFYVLSPEEERELAKRKSEGDKEAREKLINHNLRLVISVAKKYRYPGMEFMDLIQEGVIGLMTAIDKFDYTMGFKLSSYATLSIKRRIWRISMHNGDPAAIPEYIKALTYKMHLIEKDYVDAHNGKMPSYEYLAREMGVTVDKIKLIKKTTRTPVSLDAEVYEDDRDSVSLKDTLVSEKLTPEEEIIKQELCKVMRECVDDIKKERVRRVIIERFGLDGNPPKTLQEIGDEMHVTRERIRQYELQGLNILRKPRMMKKYGHFIET